MTPVENKYHILSISAIIISLVSIFFDFKDYLIGSDISLEPINQVLIANKNYGEIDYFISTTKPIYINSGATSYHDILMNEKLIFKIGQKTIILVAEKYVMSGRSALGNIEIEIKSDADPVLIKGQSVEVHETLFVPWVDKDRGNSNYVRMADFIEMLGGVETVQVEFIADLMSGDSLYSSCTLIVGEFLGHLEDKGATPPVCYSNSTDVK